MIIFLYGPDSYRKNIKIKEILTDYKQKHSAFSVERFDLAENSQFDKLKDFIKSKSLFDDLRLGIISNGSLLEKSEQKEFINILKETIKTKELILVVLENKAPTKDFKFLLEKPILVQSFESLFGTELREFFLKEIKKRGLTLDRNSQDLLLGLYKDDSWGLVTELDKLALLNEKKITIETLKSHINAFLPVDIFSALSHLKNSAGISEKLPILEELLTKGEDSAMVFNFLSTFMKSPSDKQKMADYDAAIKSGKMDYEEALTEFILG